jgi:hypothetical protein
MPNRGRCLRHIYAFSCMFLAILDVEGSARIGDLAGTFVAWVGATRFSQLKSRFYLVTPDWNANNPIADIYEVVRASWS